MKSLHTLTFNGSVKAVCLGAIAAIKMVICPSSMESMVFSHVEVKMKKERTKKRMLTSPFGTLLQKIIVEGIQEIQNQMVL
jgi:predicted permease